MTWPACRTRRSRNTSAKPASTSCSTCAAGAAAARRKYWRCVRRAYRSTGSRIPARPARRGSTTCSPTASPCRRHSQFTTASASCACRARADRNRGAGVVFCCFNNSYKLNPRSMGRALAVLHGVPGSVLWLLSGPGRADERLREFAKAQGVDPRRLVFMPKQPHAEYMARLQHADLFLDTEPYNAHTTASDALWAGCPVLTRPGETFAARVAGSLNHHLGMPMMNVDSDAAFVARATALGRDPQALSVLREELAQRRQDSGLFDMPGFARDFTAVVHTMAGG